MKATGKRDLQSQAIIRTVSSVQARLARAGVESPRVDAEIIVAEAAGVDRDRLFAIDSVALNEVTLELLVKARECRMPVQYVTGKAEFFSLDFKVTPNTLIPRPSTESLVEKAIQIIGNRSLIFLDVGTGCGNIGLSILVNCRNCRGVLSDISFEALQVAKENAIRHAVSDRAFFVNANMLDGLEPGFDLIVSNPPYVKSADLPSLQPEVEFEPLTALDGGSDGLLFINRLIASRQFLKPGGRILVEKGYDQNIEGYETLEDLDGVGRVIVI